MMRLRALVVVVGLLVMSAFAQAEIRPNEIIVKYREGQRRDRRAMEQIYEAAGVVKVKRFSETRTLEQLVLEEGTDLEKVIAELERSPLVEFAEPNAVLHALPITENTAERARMERDQDSDEMPCIPGMPIPGCKPMPCIVPNFPPGCKDDGDSPDPQPTPEPSPSPKPPGRPAVGDRPDDVNPPVVDPDLSQAYGLSKMSAPEAWKIAQGSHDMVVAVIDTGVDYNHEDLGYNMWRNPNVDSKTNDVVGFDFVHNDGLPFDDHAHGTHCSGAIGAVGGNGKGISGVSPRVSIMAIKFLSADGSGDEAGAIRSIDYAVAHGAKILSNSWGGSGNQDVKGLKDAIVRAEAKGVLFVAAAGNDSSDNDKTPEFPGGFDIPNIVAVAATDTKDELAYFSNYGKNTVHVGAPGVDVYSSVPGNKYEKMSGTSMACPYVAGAAALVWSAHPDWTHAQVKAQLIKSVDKVKALDGKTVSGGRVNVLKALSSD